MPNFPEKKILRLTTGIEDRRVWMLPGEGPPTCSDLEPADLVAGFELSRPKHPKFRVVGTKENAELVSLLYSAKSKGTVQIASIELCSPLCCSSSQQRKEPEALLYAMRRWQDWTTSKGGWHEMDASDYLTYGLVRSLDNNNQKVTDILEESFRRCHPIWPYLSFVPTIDVKACVKLVALILDPRWYVDVSHPDRSSKFEAFLGLGNGRYPDRAGLVRAAWQGGHTIPKNLEDPHNFLWRVCQSVPGNRGVLKASRLFATFLRTAWVDTQYPNKPEPLFDPGLFFSRKSEAKAFTQHLSSFVRE